MNKTKLLLDSSNYARIMKKTGMLTLCMWKNLYWWLIDIPAVCDLCFWHVNNLLAIFLFGLEFMCIILIG